MAEDMSDAKSSKGRILRRPVNENFVTLKIRRPKKRRTSHPCLVPQISNMSDSGADNTILGDSVKRMKAAHKIARQTSEAIQPPVMVTDQHTEPDYRIALDFGTTYTSVAFARKGDPKIHTINQWDGDSCQHLNHRQVPTESVYSLASRLHGYQAQRWRKTLEPDDRIVAHVKRMKLLLDDTGCAWTRDAKGDVAKEIQKLQAHCLIESEHDIIQHILVYYFHRIKKTLKGTYSFNDDESVELTFSVPVCWSTMANALMSKCIESAMQASGFGLIRDQHGSTVNLFMVNEAEAGASYALEANQRDGVIKRMGVFLLVDSGGGTTDLGLYRTTEVEPLRLEKEINPPSGAMCGSSDLNERMRAFALSDLRDQEYLLEMDTFEAIVDKFVMPDFENEHKRSFEWRDKSQRFIYEINGLQASQNNRGIQKGCYVLDYDDMWGIFEPSLEIIRHLMEEQISSAITKNIVVDSIVVIGGFGDSPALREYLRIWLNLFNHDNGSLIDMKFALANKGASAIAMGAIMRAQNKQLGPERIPTQSIGIYRHINWEEDSTDPCITKQKAQKDGEGEYVIKNTILWILKKGHDVIPRVHRVEAVVRHLFSENTRYWKGQELLFISDSCTEDYWQRTSKHNKGKTTQLGRIVFDVTDLKEHHIKAHKEKGLSTRDLKIRVEVLLQIEIIGRDLKFFVRWPANREGKLLPASRSSFSLAAAFKPGTE
ncbi:hypothetical protein AG0111_0g12188 [Alternaria gaisen]|uniref:Uncharacterized protein n=1 Tax=Alternaria gaisen TaxID=167740 RepID=A0ACB6F5J8_9PLEO|nr:hypothetical protein AG0111_0g12188 [Alternaria gaisen]